MARRRVPLSAHPLIRLSALFLLGIACRPEHSPDRVTVFAATSLTDAFRDLADTLQARHPGLVVDVNLAGSQALALQIVQGARSDVFASADLRWMQLVVDSGLVDSTPRIFANNRLVAIVPAANPGHVGRLEDLGRKGLKIVLAAESVPAGHYARTVLANLAVLPSFGADYAARVTANVVSNEETVKGVVTKVSLGEADAGIVYNSDVTPAVAAKVTRIAIPDAQNIRAEYPVAILRHATNPAGAREFMDLVFSRTGQAVLVGRGFLLPSM